MRIGIQKVVAQMVLIITGIGVEKIEKMLDANLKKAQIFAYSSELCLREVLHSITVHTIIMPSTLVKVNNVYIL